MPNGNARLSVSEGGAVACIISKADVPPDNRDEVKARKPGELIAMAKACVAAETARIDEAQ